MADDRSRGVLSRDHPVMAHIIPIRRCNLSCTYCNEYDDFSKPVPVEMMTERLNQLADWAPPSSLSAAASRCCIPELDELIAHVRKRSIIAGLITNGYLLTPQRIRQLNDAGLDHMQISIDNVMPDEVSKKSLKVLDKKLQMLAEHALFHVNINSVLGGGIHNPGGRAGGGQARDRTGLHFDDRNHSRRRRAAAAHRRARAGRVSRNEDSSRRRTSRSSIISRTTSRTDGPMTGAAGRARATCTSAKTAWCIIAPSSAAFRPSRWRNIRSTDIRREYLTKKGCAPLCTISCVHQISYMDFWRDPQTIEGDAPVEANELVRIQSAR